MLDYSVILFFPKNGVSPWSQFFCQTLSITEKRSDTCDCVGDLGSNFVYGRHAYHAILLHIEYTFHRGSDFEEVNSMKNIKYCLLALESSSSSAASSGRISITRLFWLQDQSQDWFLRLSCDLPLLLPHGACQLNPLESLFFVNSFDIRLFRPGY